MMFFATVMLRSRRHRSSVESHIVGLEERRLMSVVRPLSGFDEFAVAVPDHPRVSAVEAELTVGADGNVWFTDPDANLVGKVTPRGVVTEFHLSDFGPRAIAAGPEGNLWVTVGAAGGSPAIDRITTSGQVTRFALPNDIAQAESITVGPDGNLWFAEDIYSPNSEAVVRLTPSGQFTEFRIPYEGFSAVMEGIAPGPDGNLYFAHNGYLGKATPSGALTDLIAPAGVAVTSGPDGNIWSVGTRYNQQTGEVMSAYVERITPAGAVTTFDLPSRDAAPQSITRGRDGNLWFTEPGINKIARVTTGGKITEFTAPSAASEPGGITAGPDGNIWFTELGSNHIARYMLNRGFSAATPILNSIRPTTTSSTFHTDKLISILDADPLPVA